MNHAVVSLLVALCAVVARPVPGALAANGSAEPCDTCSIVRAQVLEVGADPLHARLVLTEAKDGPMLVILERAAVRVKVGASDDTSGMDLSPSDRSTLSAWSVRAPSAPPPGSDPRAP